MRVDIKTVKGKDYVQLVDDNKFIHHVGPANVTNLAAALYAKGFHEISKIDEWLEEYYTSKGHVLDDNTRHKVSEIAILYYDGLQGFSPRESDLYDEKEVEMISHKIYDRIYVLNMIRSDMIEAVNRAGRHVNEAQLRRTVQKVYREASEEQRRKFKEELDKRFNEQLLSASITNGSFL